MLFSSPLFLFAFLPLALGLYYLAPRSLQNLTLLLFSLLFYAWGEPYFVLALVGSIAVNYAFGLLLGRTAEVRSRTILALGVGFNLALLGYFKYTNFFVENFNSIRETLGWAPLEVADIRLPLGVSFFTFQAMSYLVDVYRREVEPQRNPFDLALYIVLFPQLIAGPIVRYHDIALQLRTRRASVVQFARGIERFVWGLAKKVIIANPLGAVADDVFALPPDELGASLAWLGICAYTLQIYFDFSGYSDMAIGLGRMFGFEFLENFDYPYTSQSIREFWRRWHISLSTWFRDYLYIPLGGNRTSNAATYTNLWLVFLLCGLWHGASWNFLLWGALHGMFLVLERAGLSRILARCPRTVRHAYVLAVVVHTWVPFRAETIEQTLAYLASMYGLHDPGTAHRFAEHFGNMVAFTFGLGIIASVPILRWLKPAPVTWKSSIALSLVLATVFLLCASKISAGTYDPFIYFRF